MLAPDRWPVWRPDVGRDRLHVVDGQAVRRVTGSRRAAIGLLRERHTVRAPGAWRPFEGNGRHFRSYPGFANLPAPDVCAGTGCLPAPQPASEGVIR